MARPWRILYEDAIYHVTSRGNNRGEIFIDDKDKDIFIELLERTTDRFELEILAFCLMNNHYHLFLRTPKANLSSGLHWLNSTYAMRFNRKYGRSGHLFQGRYNAVLVIDEAHWLHLSMYVHLNPVRAGMVDDPADYEWSSFRDYTRPRLRFEWLMREEILAAYGQGTGSRFSNYRRECLELAGKKPDFVDKIRRGGVLGTAEKIMEMLNKYESASQEKKATGRTVKLASSEVDIAEELERVSGVFGVKPEELKSRRRKFPARLATYYHLVEHCGICNNDTAIALGVSPMAVSLGIRRLAAYMQNDADLKEKIRQLSLK